MEEVKSHSSSHDFSKPFAINIWLERSSISMRRTLFLTFSFALLLTLISCCFAFISATPGYALTNSSKKPALTLNRSQGPLGVILTLRGKYFPPGSANLSYIDANNVPGIFSAPGDTSVVVQPSGAFLTTNLVLPSSGPAGNWKIIVTDSQGNLNTIRYTVLAAPEQKTAGAPTLVLTLPNGISSNPNATATPTESGTLTATPSPTGTASATPTSTPTASSGDTTSIAFTGSNWLPKGTVVKLILHSGTTSLPLLEPPPVSNANGMISGSFYLPSNLTNSTGDIIATDASTGALRAQVSITVTNGMISFTPTATPQPSPDSTPIKSTAGTPIASSSNGPASTFNPLANLNPAIWGPVLLVAGAMLAIAGLMLILYMIPWSRDTRHQNHHTRGGQ